MRAVHDSQCGTIAPTEEAMRVALLLVGVLFFARVALGASQATFDSDQSQWVLNNGLIRAVFQLTPDGYFLTKEIQNSVTGDRWAGSANRTSSPIRLQAGEDLFDSQTQFRFAVQYSQTIVPAGVRQS